jgi:hypothetical protein
MIGCSIVTVVAAKELVHALNQWRKDNDSTGMTQ